MNESITELTELFDKLKKDVMLVQLYNSTGREDKFYEKLNELIVDVHELPDCLHGAIGDCECHSMGSICAHFKKKLEEIVK